MVGLERDVPDWEESDRTRLTRVDANGWCIRQLAPIKNSSLSNRRKGGEDMGTLVLYGRAGGQHPPEQREQKKNRWTRGRIGT